MLQKNLIVKFITLYIILFPFKLFAQNFILTAPPREAPNEADKLYSGLAHYLSKATGKKIVYKHPGNWLSYQRDMRNDKYDIIFDGPHFTSWRLKHLGHNVIVKLPKKLKFVLATKKNNNKIKNRADLIGKNICGVSPPHLSTLSILKLFTNPSRQPVIIGVKGHMANVLKALNDNECVAGVFVTHFYNNNNKQLQDIDYSIELPDQAISASKRVSATDRELISKAILDENGKSYIHGVMKKYGGGSTHFVSATNAEYKGYNSLIEGVIFGW